MTTQGLYAKIDNVLLRFGITATPRNFIVAKYKNLSGNTQKVEPPKPYTLHPTPYTLHPTPYPFTLHPTPYTLHPSPHTLNP